jgi:hypothetical protein
MVLRVLGLFSVCFVASVCGGGSTPTSPAPAPLNITGIWDVTTTLTGGSGLAECIALFSIGQQFRSVANIQHSGTTVAAQITGSSGAVFSYTGTLNDGQFFVTLTTAGLPFTRTPCASGTLYDFRSSANTLNGAATATVITGSGAETIDIYSIPPAPFPQQGLFPAGSMSIQSTIRLTKR